MLMQFGVQGKINKWKRLRKKSEKLEENEKLESSGGKR